MKILGLTGSIGMGKSTTADLFREAGIPVFDSDAEIHNLQAKGSPLLAEIEAAFPGVVKDGELDRAQLRTRVFGDDKARKRLEAITHPALGRVMQKAFADAEKNAAPMLVLDVPLLFEVGRDAMCDKVVVCSAPADVQRDRVLARPGMTPQIFADILAAQMPDADKRARADYIVDTSNGIDDARRQVLAIIADMEG